MKYVLALVLLGLARVGLAQDATVPAPGVPSPTVAPRLTGRGKIIFEGVRSGGWSVWAMNADGSNEQWLTSRFRTIKAPRPSPDGKRIIFIHHYHLSSQIWTMNADGTDDTPISSLAPDDPTIKAISNYAPVFSPDGKRIAFSSTRDGNAEIYTAKLDGSDLKRLTNSPEADGAPCFSPDGKRIAWRVATALGQFNPENPRKTTVWIMNTDGSNATQLTRSGAEDEPYFSPDGRFIAFTSRLGKFPEIHVMDADGSSEVALTTQRQMSNFRPSWIEGNVTP